MTRSYKTDDKVRGRERGRRRQREEWGVEIKREEDKSEIRGSNTDEYEAGRTMERSMESKIDGKQTGRQREREKQEGERVSWSDWFEFHVGLLGYARRGRRHPLVHDVCVLGSMRKSITCQSGRHEGQLLSSQPPPAKHKHTPQVPTHTHTWKLRHTLEMYTHTHWSLRSHIHKHTPKQYLYTQTHTTSERRTEDLLV